MSEFVEFLSEVFDSFGPIYSRKMFGGHGIYFDGLMFGLVASDELYLKADAESVKEFEAVGSEPFEFMHNGKLGKMSYYKAPEGIFEDQEAAKLWATRGYEAALRADAIKRKRKSKKKKGNR